jgi:hypothetical protein
MRVRVAIIFALILVAWSASPSIPATDNPFGNGTVAGNNNVVFSQGSNAAMEADPHLAVILAADSLNKDDATYHVEVENSDRDEIVVLQCVYRTPNFSDGVIFPKDERPTVYGTARIKIPREAFIGSAPPPTPFDVLIVYGTPRKTFGAAYRFLVDVSGGLPKRFFPVDWRAIGRSFDIQKALQKQIVTALKKPAGNIFVMLPETRPDGSPNNFNIRTRDRDISFNSTAGTVQFGSQSTVLRSSLDERNRRFHTLVASWDEAKQLMSLAIDGGVVSK